MRDAKATLSALAGQAAHGEAAVITRRGASRAVILGIEEWDRRRDIPSFGRLLLSAPLEDKDRSASPGTKAAGSRPPPAIPMSSIEHDTMAILVRERTSKSQQGQRIIYQSHDPRVTRRYVPA